MSASPEGFVLGFICCLYSLRQVFKDSYGLLLYHTQVLAFYLQLAFISRSDWFWHWLAREIDTCILKVAKISLECCKLLDNFQTVCQCSYSNSGQNYVILMYMYSDMFQKQDVGDNISGTCTLYTFTRIEVLDMLPFHLCILTQLLSFEQLKFIGIVHLEP